MVLNQFSIEGTVTLQANLQLQCLPCTSTVKWLQLLRTLSQTMMHFLNQLGSQDMLEQPMHAGTVTFKTGSSVDCSQPVAKANRKCFVNGKVESSESHLLVFYRER